MVKIKKLANGLRTIIIPVSGTKTATVLIMVGTGSKYENKNNNGISHFLEHMFFKGTEKRPTATAISSELDGIGGEYNAFTGKEITGYYAKVDAEKIEVALDVLSDMLLNSQFDEEEIKREKGVIIEEINMYEDNPLMHIEDVFEECLYGDQPAGWETIGTKENIVKMKRDDFVNYIKSQYGTKSAVVAVAGKIDRKTTALINKYFSKFPKNKFIDKGKIKDVQAEPSVKIKNKKTDQAHISLGVRAYKAGHKDEYILKAISILLGGSMSSRLFINLRERNGLAYYVRTGTEFYTDSGYMTTQAGVPVDKIEDAIKIIASEYKRLKDELVDKNELEKVMDMIKGKLVIQMEASEANANWYARQVIMNKKISAPEEYLKKIKQVKPKDIMRVAREVFRNEKLNLAVIGPYEESEKFKKLLNV